MLRPVLRPVRLGLAQLPQIEWRSLEVGLAGALLVEALIAFSLMLKAQTYAVHVNAEAYATRFCEMYRAGAPLHQSTVEALKVSRTNPGITTQVTHTGTTYNADTYAATHLSLRRCAFR
ncbi:MAG: hypothetical protein ACO3GP_07530 [Candidatus Limnocylindrus sp.]